MKNMHEILENYFETIDILAKQYAAPMLAQRKNIDKVLHLLSDDDSRELYGQELIFCTMKNFLNSDKASTYAGLMSDKDFKAAMRRAQDNKHFNEIICNTDPSSSFIKNYCIAATFELEQYKYKNIVKVEKGDICLDVGACLGDTAIYMIDNGAEHVHSFEIDNTNISCMKKMLQKTNLKDKISIHENCISSSIEKWYYQPNASNAGGGIITKEKSDSAYEVDVDTIDNFTKQRGIIPTFIKMDIEGAEVDALLGARKTLEKYAPKLAISIYHKWSHRWEIPLLIHSFCEDYKFYLKKSHPRAETVLFCTR